MISKIGAVEDALKSLDSEIAHVQEQISQTEKEISTAEDKGPNEAADVKKIEWLSVKVDRLRGKENILREEKTKLREKEIILRKEMAKLTEKEDKLRQQGPFSSFHVRSFCSF